MTSTISFVLPVHSDPKIKNSIRKLGTTMAFCLLICLVVSRYPQYVSNMYDYFVKPGQDFVTLVKIVHCTPFGWALLKVASSQKVFHPDRLFKKCVKL